VEVVGEDPVGDVVADPAAVLHGRAEVDATQMRALLTSYSRSPGVAK
jgi:hypothetical protein